LQDKFKKTKEDLNKARDELKAALVGRSMKFLESNPDLVFIIRDLYIHLTKDKKITVLDQLTSDLDGFMTKNTSFDGDIGKLFAVRLRLIALIFSESSLQPKLADYAGLLYSKLMTIFSNEISQSQHEWKS